MPMIRGAARRVPSLLIALFAANPAAAHGPIPTTPDTLWSSWTFAPWIIGPLLLAHWLYGRGFARMQSEARGARTLLRRRAGCFLGGEIALVVALVSPLDSLSGTLFSAHMAQHALLITAGPALLLLGRPGATMMRGLPRPLRRGLARSRTLRTAVDLLSSIARPLPAAGLHGLAIWVWHAPVLFDAATVDDALHAAEHASFFLTALLFWGSLIAAARRLERIGPAILAALLTLMHGGMLGALLGLSTRPFYPWYDGRTALWGLSPLEDQNLAGLLMWVPLAPAYIGAGLILAGRLVVGAGTNLDRASFPGRGDPVNRDTPAC